MKVCSDSGETQLLGAEMLKHIIPNQEYATSVLEPTESAFGSFYYTSA